MILWFYKTPYIMKAPKRKSEQNRKYDDVGGPVYLTKEAVERMKKTLARLEKQELPQAIEDTRRTGEFGDFSENAEYQEAKHRMRGLHARIFSLKEKLKHAIEIVPGSDGGFVRLGSTVTLETNGKQKVFQIVGPQETDPRRGRISHLSPLGATLLNHGVGDTITLHTEKGEVHYAIIKLE